MHYHQDVRTTITLDEDVARKLRAEMRRSGKGFKEVVNENLRRALNAPEAERRQEPFVVRPRPLQLRPGLTYDNVAELLEQLEGPGRR